MTFHKLGNDLVKAEYTNAKCIEGSGGDEGMDCYDGDLGAGYVHVFQHKFLRKTLASAGKCQIKDSLKTLIDKHKNVRKWTLLLPKDFTIGESKWFQNTIKNKYTQLEIEVWNETHLKSLLNKHLAIRRDYFPLSPSIEKRLDEHFKDIKELVIDPLLNIIEFNPTSLPTVEKINPIKTDLLSESKHFV